jgi:hypothetical protein
MHVQVCSVSRGKLAPDAPDKMWPGWLTGMAGILLLQWNMSV